MSTEASLRYCDGETIKSRCVSLERMPDGSIVINDGEHSHTIPDGGYSISDALGSIPRFLRINAGGVVELPVDGELVASFDGEKSPVIARTVHWLESQSAMAAIAAALVALIVSIGVWQGLPRLARRLALTVPLSIEQQAGQTAYKVFSANFRRTGLDFFTQARVQQQLDRLLAAQPSEVPVKLVFLQMGSPNAFALPGGLIVIADELVQLTSNEDEIAAVLAHELGHVERRHGLQSVLRNSAALIVVSTITGDLSTLSTFSATLPFLLLQYGYAREFETEADRDAIDLLQKAGIDPENLASILSQLENARPRVGADFSYLSTHPSTEDRVQAMRSASSRLGERIKSGSSPAAPGQQVHLAPFPADETTLHGQKNPGFDRDSPPRLVFHANPAYPRELRELSITGTSLVEFVVTTEGDVTDLKVVSASHPLFGEAAVEAVSRWKFDPGKLGGKPVNVKMQQPVSFSLEDELH